MFTYVFLYVCTSVYVRVWRSEVNVQCALASFYNFFLIQALLLTLEITSWLDWLADKGSSCPHPHFPEHRGYRHAAMHSFSRGC